MTASKLRATTARGTDFVKQNSLCFDVFEQCVLAVQRGELITAVSAKDKEFHFQQWFEQRLKSLSAHFESSGRNTYPDFCLVEYAEGYEVKGLAFPGREHDYDSNSQVPSGLHNGRQIFYVFGRYPADLSKYPSTRGGKHEYPVIDLVLCHGDFLNATRDYVHKNKNVKGFGSYGDVMIRDRKMYVAPTPFALTDGATGLMTLIVPEGFVADARFQRVGTLQRTEAKRLVVGYSFDLQTNVLKAEHADNPSAGKTHKFAAYRLLNQAAKPIALHPESAAPKTDLHQ